MKSNKWMKTCAAVLALTLAAGSMAACGGGGNAGGSSAAGGGSEAAGGGEASASAPTLKAGEAFKAAEPLTVTMLYYDHPNYPYKADWLLWSAIKDATNVTIEPTVVPSSDYVQKRSLLISSGDAPQILAKTYAGEEVPFIPSGAIIPVSDYTDYFPNYISQVEKWQMEPELTTLKQRDGKYYMLSGLHEKAKADYSYIIRKDILDELGLQVPETYDDFYNMLKAMKEKTPGQFPFSDRFKGDSTLNLVSVAFGVTAGWGKGDGKIFDRDAAQFVFGPTSDKYREFLRYMNKLSSEGLFDPEGFTQTDDQAKGKFTNGSSYVMNSNLQETQAITETMKSTMGEGKFELVHIVPPVGPAGNVIGGDRRECGVMLNSSILKEARRDEIFNFVDWLWYSDDGQILTRWGVEGTTYTVENGERKLMPDIDYLGMNPSGTKDLRKDYGFCAGVWLYGGPQELKYSIMNDMEQEFQQNVSEKREFKQLEPPVLFDEMQREEMNMINQPLMDYVQQMTLKFILGSEDLEKGWDAFVKECETKGSTKFIDTCNQVYNETKDMLQ